MWPGPRYPRAKFHLDPSNRLATIHQRHIQTGQDRTDRTGRQRSDSIGRTVLQTVAQKGDECKTLVETAKSTRRLASADRTARRQFQATGQPVSRTQAMRRSVCNAGASNAGSTPPLTQLYCRNTFAFRYQGNGATPCQYIDTTRKAIDCAMSLRVFLYNDTLQQTFRPLLSKLSKIRQI